MKKIISFFCLTSCFIYSTALCQSDIALPGVVVIHNSKYNTGEIQYISGASIKSPVKSIPTSSDSKGKFTLVFADKPPGDIAPVQVDKSGYELVNAKDMTAAAVIGRLSPLKVVMCKEGTLNQNRMIYYDVSIRGVQKLYEERHSVLLQKQGEEYEKVVKLLERELNRKIEDNKDALVALDSQLTVMKKQALELSEKFVIINLDDESQTYQRAFRAFSDGSVDLAIRILDSVDLEQRIIQNDFKKQKAQSAINSLQTTLNTINVQIQQDVNQCVLLARMYKIEKKYLLSMKNYETAVKYDTSNLDIYRELRDIYFWASIDANDYDKLKEIKINEFELSKKIVSKSRTIFENDPEFQRSSFLSDLSKLAYQYKARKDFINADKCFSEGVQIWRQMPKTDSNLYHLVNYLQDLGFCRLDADNLKNADSNFKEGLDILKILVEHNPKAYNRELFEYLNSLGKAYKNANHFAEAEPFYIENYNLTFKLYKKDPLTYQNDLFEIIQIFTELYISMNDYVRADLYINKFEETWESLQETLYKNEYKILYNDYIPMFYKIFADYYVTTNDSVQAEKYYLKSLSSWKATLATDYKRAYEYSYANDFKKIAGFYEKRKNFAKAESNYLQSLKIYRKLSASDAPEFRESGLPDILTSLGVLYHNNKMHGKALIYYDEALQISQKLAKVKPLDNDPTTALILNNLGILYNTDKEYDKAKKYFNEAFELRSKLYNVYPEYYGIDLLATISKLVFLYANLADNSNNPTRSSLFRDSIVIFQRTAVEVNEKKFNEYPYNKIDTTSYAESLGNLSFYLLFVKKFAESEKAARHGFELDKSQLWIATNIADALLFQGKYEEAEKQFLFLKTLKDSNGKPFKEALLQDLEDLQKAGISHPDAIKIKKLLEE